jgi:hypothetical protein
MNRIATVGIRSQSPIFVLVFKDWAAFGDSSAEPALIKKIYPDQDKYKREEQRRFELLEAHWDVPLNPVAMK